MNFATLNSQLKSFSIHSTAAAPEADPAADPAADPEADPEAAPAAAPEADPAADPAADPEADPEAAPAADPAAAPEADPEADPAADFAFSHNHSRFCSAKASSRDHFLGSPIVCCASAVVRSRGGPAGSAGPPRKKNMPK